MIVLVVFCVTAENGNNNILQDLNPDFLKTAVTERTKLRQ